MKTIFVALFVIFTTAAFGQTAPVLSNQVQRVVVPEHIEHASQHELSSEQSLVGGGGYTYAQGERPLWEFGPISQPVPLGDIARAYRREKERTKMQKAGVIFEKQGT
jgi:hypothetical protein